MRKYRKTTQLAFGLLVLTALWLIVPAMAGGGDPDKARQAWPMIENGALVIDVRSAEEFDAGHLEGSININWDETGTLKAAIGSNKQRQVVLYCRSGNRVGKAIVELEKDGYSNLYNATGLEVLKATKP